MTARRDLARFVTGRRLIGAAAIASVVAAGSCGSPDDPSSQSTSTAPAVIRVATTIAAGDEDDGAGADPALETMRLAHLEYRYEGDLPALDGSAPSWSYPADVELPEGRLRAIADALGVTGEEQQLAADQGGGWVIGATDGSAPSVTVSRSALLDWWYSPGAPIDAAAEAALPTAAEAQARAEIVLTAAGYDLAQHELDVQADEQSVSVTAWRLLEGRRSPISVSIGFGAGGAVTWMSGTLAEPQRGTDYPLIGTTAGLERLQAQADGWVTAGDVTNAGSGDPTADTEQSEPIQVTLTAVKEDLTMVWALDGQVWILPAYTFTSTDGGLHTIVAIPDEYLDRGEPVAPPPPDATG